eukprot:TRINITY_DN13616_c0_g2_i1.p2 TRINITY_DN13616_c0_g2~~TRINITY_DN13616_c0_g2_i1.p2  ORF type:complete len:465 (+),score=116.11 TRINITY_DN13616_c0_g2_i1:102-1397(+)
MRAGLAACITAASLAGAAWLTVGGLLPPAAPPQQWLPPRSATPTPPVRLEPTRRHPTATPPVPAAAVLAPGWALPRGAAAALRAAAATSAAAGAVVVLASGSHRASLANWLRFAERAAPGLRAAVVCLDAAVAEWLPLLPGGPECALRLDAAAAAQPTWDRRAGAACQPPPAAPPEPAPSAAECRRRCAAGPRCAAYSYAAGLCRLCPSGAGLRPAPAPAEAWQRRPGLPLFRLRGAVLGAALRAGVAVLSSDLDAVWLRDPLPEVGAALREGFDVVAQRGSFPRKHASAWGATVCMGFAALRPSPRLLSFLPEVQRAQEQERDDQAGMNAALAAAGLRFLGTPLQYANSTAPAAGETPQGLRVLLLPHSKYPRLCGDSPAALGGATVAHCFDRGVAKTDTAGRRARALARGLWDAAADADARLARPAVYR